MNGVLRGAGVTFLIAALLAPAAVRVTAHSPTPLIGWPTWNQDQVIRYRWMAGEVPPTAMQTAIKAGAIDSNESKYSRAPTFLYDPAGSSTVEYGTSVFCGLNGLACADGGNAPSTFRVAFREHGHRFDWGTLRWCQMLNPVTDGCYDVENIMLDELGHVLGLGHHVNYGNESDYGDSVVQTVSRARPRQYWNEHDFGRCDIATLQTRYDMTSWFAGYSTCLDLAVNLGLTASATTVSSGTQVTFSAALVVADNAGDGRLSGNPVSSRTVHLQRRVKGTTTWTSIGQMPAGTGAGTYVLRITPAATYEWRAVFPEPATEGLRGASSAAVAVTVIKCQTLACLESAPADDPGDRAGRER